MKQENIRKRIEYLEREKKILTEYAKRCEKKTAKKGLRKQIREQLSIEKNEMNMPKIKIK